jgi:hypothetical protein
MGPTIGGSPICFEFFTCPLQYTQQCNASKNKNKIIEDLATQKNQCKKILGLSISLYNDPYINCQVQIGDALLNTDAYTPFTWKIKFKMYKNLGKNILIYIFIYYLLTHSFIKTDIILWAVQKRQK